MRLGGVLKTVPGRRVESWDSWIDGEEVFVIPEPVEELGERAMRVVSQPALLEKLVEEASWSFENSNASQRHLQCPWPKIILKAPDNPESHKRGGFARGRTQHAQG
jgi:hypothetical protein